MTSDDTKAAARVCGFLCLLMAAAMFCVAGVGAMTDGRGEVGFALSSAFVGGVGLSMLLGHGREVGAFTARTGFVVVTASWLVASLAGAVPLVASLPVSLVDAVFESVSGLTTTGSTVFVGLYDLPDSVLIWRSVLQWLGGLGIVAMGLVLLPFLRVGGISIFRLESSDVSELASTSRVVQFSVAMTEVYVALTLLCIVVYLSFGMTPFEAVNHAMTTIATGGYSTHDESFGVYRDNLPLMLSATVFMAAASLPFSLYIAAVMTRKARLAADRQVKVFFWVAGVATLAMIAGRVGQTGEFSLQSVVSTAFNIVSVLSTTGYATEDYETWGMGAQMLFLLLTPIGGCAGSTSGGLKAYRLILVWEMIAAHVRRLVYPHSVEVSRYVAQTGGTRLRDSAIVFLFMYVAAVAAVSLALAMLGLDLLTSFTGAMTALSNVGPGLGDIIGPAGNFSTLPDAAKLVLAIAMLLGRLELVAVLVMVSPVFWRR